MYPWLWEASQGWDEALSAMREAAAEYTVAGWPLAVAVPLMLRMPLAGLRLPVQASHWQVRLESVTGRSSLGAATSIWGLGGRCDS